MAYTMAQIAAQAKMTPSQNKAVEAAKTSSSSSSSSGGGSSSNSSQLATLNAQLAAAQKQLNEATSAGYSGNQQIVYGSNGVITPANLAPGYVPPLPTTLVNQDASAYTAGIADYTKQYDALIAKQQAEQIKNQSAYDAMSKQISSLLETSGGAGAAQLEAERNLGIPKLQGELATATGQVKTGLAEYEQMKNDYAMLSATNQNNRNMTMGSIIGAEAAINTKRALELNRKASDIGLVQATAQALQGQIEAAQKTADRSVDLYYQDVKQNLEIKLAQLDLIRYDLTKSEKAVADALERKYQEEQQQLELTVADKKTQTAFNLDAMQKYPSARIQASDSYDVTQQKILGSKEYQMATTSSGGGSNQQTDNERALMSQFRGEQIVKDYNDILGQKGTIDAYIQNGVGGPADLAMVFSFMKGLDPTSVVRESEYATAAKSGNIFQGAFSKFNGYFKAKGGFLPANVKTEFQNLVNQKLNVKAQQYNNVKSQYESIANRQGLNSSNVVIDYAGGAMPQDEVTPEQKKDEDVFDNVVSQPSGYFTNLWNSLLGK